MKSRLNIQKNFLRTALMLAVIVMTFVAPSRAWADTPTGGLQVLNICSSNPYQKFSFTVTLSDNSINDTYGDMYFTNGVATFTLSSGEAHSAANLPTGIAYSVTQTSVDGFITTKTRNKGTISTTTPVAIFKNHANIADAVDDVNNAESDVTMTLCMDITGIQTSNYLYFNNVNKVNEDTPDERPVEITLDLNGHKLSGECGIGLVVVSSGTVMTITDSGNGGSISNSSGTAIDNDGTLTVSNGSITGIDGISNSSGSVTVSGGSITTTSHYGINNNNLLTISGGTINATGNASAGILNQKSLSINALPTFNSDNNVDIILNPGKVITFGADISAAPEKPIKIRTENGVPYTFTSGYGAHVKANGEIIAPGDFFTCILDPYLMPIAGIGARLTGEGNSAEAETYYPTVKVAYVDADGNLHDDADGSTASTADDMATAYILGGYETTLGKDGEEMWFLAQGTLNYDAGTRGYGLEIYGDVHLILADGCAMTVEGGRSIYGNDGASLTIYGQGGTDANGNSTEGKLNVTTTTENAIYINGSFVINGGIVYVHSSIAFAINVDDGDFTINDGQVTTDAQVCIQCLGANLTINGGQVTANAGISVLKSSNEQKGILTINGGQVTAYLFSAESFTLGWTNITDFIKCRNTLNSLYNSVKISDGKYFSDGTTVYDSSTSSETLRALTGMTLRPAQPIEGGVPYVTMTMDNGSWKPIGDVKAFLPTGYEFGGSEVSLTEVQGAPKYKPVIFGNAEENANLPDPFFLAGVPESSEDEDEVTAETILDSYDGTTMDGHFVATGDNEKLQTVIESVVKPASDAIVMILSGGKFRAVDVSSGDLEKTAKSGLLLFILSKWEYMQVGSNAGGGSAGTRGIGIGDGGATSLTPIPSPTGEGSNAQWYDLQGRRIDKPARKGVYIHHGKLVVIK